VAPGIAAARVERRVLDIARVPDEVERADVVVLHRVVCCYPDYERLLGRRGRQGAKSLAFSHPPGNLVSRAVFSAENGMRTLKGGTSRASSLACVGAVVGDGEAGGLDRLQVEHGQVPRSTGPAGRSSRARGTSSPRRARSA